MRARGLEQGVDRNIAHVVEFDAGLFQTHPLDIGYPPHRIKQTRGDDFFPVLHHDHRLAVFGMGDLLDRLAKAQIDPDLLDVIGE